jgi:hypothetical protein
MADVHQFVGEQNGLNKTAAPSINEKSQPHDFFLLYFETILAVIVQETNQYMQHDAQAKNKLDISANKYKGSVHISCSSVGS